MDPLWQQNATYSALDDREALTAFPHTGVVEAGDLKVSQRAAGVNMSVDVATGAAVIPNALAARGKYLHRFDATNLVLAASPGAGSNRIDLVVARVEDTEYGDATDSGILEVVTGTTAATPSAPATPAGSILLATVYVAATVASIADASITDARQYARGVVYTDRRPTGAPNGQVAIAASGLMSYVSGAAWMSLPMASQFGGDRAVMASTSLSTTATGYATATVPQPGAAVSVTAHFHGTAAAAAGSSDAVAQILVQISLNGGSTWSSGTQIPGLSTNSLTFVPISNGHQVTGTPTGSVQARVLANRSGTPGVLLHGSVILTVTPD